MCFTPTICVRKRLKKQEMSQESVSAPRQLPARADPRSTYGPGEVVWKRRPPQERRRTALSEQADGTTVILQRAHGFYIHLHTLPACTEESYSFYFTSHSTYSQVGWTSKIIV